MAHLAAIFVAAYVVVIYVAATNWETTAIVAVMIEYNYTPRQEDKIVVITIQNLKKS